MEIRSVERPEKIPSSRTQVQYRRCLRLALSVSFLFSFLFLFSYFFLSHLTI